MPLAIRKAVGRKNIAYKLSIITNIIVRYVLDYEKLQYSSSIPRPKVIRYCDSLNIWSILRKYISFWHIHIYILLKSSTITDDILIFEIEIHAVGTYMKDLIIIMSHYIKMWYQYRQKSHNFLSFFMHFGLSMRFRAYRKPWRDVSP